MNEGHLSIQDSQLGPNGVLHREVPLYCLLVPLYNAQGGSINTMWARHTMWWPIATPQAEHIRSGRWMGHATLTGQ